MKNQNIHDGLLKTIFYPNRRTIKDRKKLKIKPSNDKWMVNKGLRVPKKRKKFFKKNDEIRRREKKMKKKATFEGRTIKKTVLSLGILIILGLSSCSTQKDTYSRPSLKEECNTFSKSNNRH